ncbi:MAG: hypothetical protein K2X37_10805 [Chitinophagaceae bacterium]|jgi:hypothetical protein|uniref:hypothetical protein n=1 Tax=Flavobacterium sp. 102 TaxID=2135623 RepID=UPI000EAF3EAF|nr:hypothetical protein [Flavobacterium sp. 102]MBX9734539.1 hypothetical protein [Chitinophagaceae bacterium]RKS03342.1 hypothetical protein C8C84_3098 [Flavobacterium sp. 102]
MKKAKMFLSVALFSAVAFGAFANASKAKTVSTVPGYIKQGLSCVYKNDCSNVPSMVLCTDNNGAQIFDRTDATHCAVDLWKL